MDGSCIEMPDQRPRGEEGEPRVMHFNTEVIRLQPVRQGPRGFDDWAGLSWAVGWAALAWGGVGVMGGGLQLGLAAERAVELCCLHGEACGLQCQALTFCYPGCLQIIAAAVMLHQDISRASAKVTRHLDGWRKHADIWKQVRPVPAGLAA